MRPPPTATNRLGGPLEVDRIRPGLAYAGPLGTEVDTQSSSLWTRLPRWLRPPVFADEAKTHEAFLLHVILYALVLVPLPYVLGVAIRTPMLMGRAFVQGLSGEAANAILILLLRAGHVWAASLLQACALLPSCPSAR